MFSFPLSLHLLACLSFARGSNPVCVSFASRFFTFKPRVRTKDRGSEVLSSSTADCAADDVVRLRTCCAVYTVCGLCTSDVSTCHPPVIHHVVQHVYLFPRVTGWVLLHLLCTHHLHVVRTSDVISSFVIEATSCADNGATGVHMHSPKQNLWWDQEFASEMFTLSPKQSVSCT